MPIKMLSQARHWYKGKKYLRNDQFSVDSDKDADDLVALRFAIRVPVPAAPAYASKEMDAAPEPNADLSERGKRHYKRRDMTAE